MNREDSIRSFEKKEIRLIGLDLDGTTLTTQKVLTDHTKEVLEACLKAGIQILPATGRAKSGVPEYLRTIDGIRYVLTSNGAAVIDLSNGETVYQNGIDWERGLELCDILEEYDTFYDMYIDGCGWCEPRFYDHLDRFGISKEIKKVIRDSRTRIEDLREIIRSKKMPIEKVNMFFADENQRQKAFRELGAYEDLAVTWSLDNNLEINAASCNKGEALIALGRILSIDMEEIMACGDGNNDLEMIKLAGLGVAMANAIDTLKDSADYITKSNDEEGVAWAIEQFCNLSL